MTISELVRKAKNEHYYGSPLNRFIDEKCSHEMTCINIDCLLVKISKRKVRIIESKHLNEMLPRSQRTALTILKQIVDSSPQTDWSIEFYEVRGDYPYHKAEITRLNHPETRMILSQKALINWLNFGD